MFHVNVNLLALNLCNKTIRIPLFWKYLYDMAMKRKFIIYAHGNRNYGYCRLHFVSELSV